MCLNSIIMSEQQQRYAFDYMPIVDSLNGGTTRRSASRAELGLQATSIR